VVICLERGANDLHMVQLMPLPPHHLSLQENREWFTFLVPAYKGCPGKRPLNGCSVVVVVLLLTLFSQYCAKRLAWKNRLQNIVFCVDWDVKP